MKMRFLSIFLLAFFFKDSLSACVDKFALSSVDALVHKQRNSKAILFERRNFNLLDDYIAIDVTSANVSQLCEGMIKNFTRLETLSLINVNLTIIEPGAFQNVPKLKHLSLSVNQLVTIPREVFNVIPSLQVIYLTRNQIETVEDGAFSQMPELKAVHLEHNRLTQLPGNVFTESPKVSLIDFSYNMLNNIPKNAFDGLRPGNNTRILNIHLKRNEIVEIDPEAFKQLIPVNLHLESNKITRISDALFSVEEGSTVYFNNNKVTCVADDALDWIKVKNISVELQGNPMVCGCVERVQTMLAGEIRGQLNVDTLPCEMAFPF